MEYRPHHICEEVVILGFDHLQLTTFPQCRDRFDRPSSQGWQNDTNKSRQVGLLG